MTPEGKVKRQFKVFAKTLMPMAWGYMPVSLGMGIHGIPDWVGVVRGRFVCVEFKATGGKTTKLQQHIHKKIVAAGGIVYICSPHNLNDVRRSIQAMAYGND